MIQAVIFDLDGVLADSMPQHAASFRAVLEPKGIPVSDRRVFELEGSRSTRVIEQLAKDAGVDLSGSDIDRLAEAKQQEFRKMGVPRLFPDAERLVLAATGLSRALVTGTRKENLDRMLGTLASRFDALLAEDAYTHSKPDPEPYERAAAALGLRPDACLAVENAPFGVQSARAAGCHVWALTTTVEGRDLAQAHRVFGTHVGLAAAMVEVAAARLAAASEEAGGTVVEP